MRYKHIILPDEETHSFQEDWIDGCNDLLKETFRVLIESEEDALPDILLTEWEDLIGEYFESYNQTATSVHSYLSQPKKLLLDVYGESKILRMYINRLFKILHIYFIAKRRHFMHNGKEIVFFKMVRILKDKALFVNLIGRFVI